jgi:uncharacterized membrane protein
MSGTVREAGADEIVREGRWPMASAVLAVIVMTVLLPDTLRHAPKWVLPVIEGLLLVALIAGDPGRINRRTRWLRVLSILLVSVLVLGSLSATAELVDDLIHGGGVTDSAGELLVAGNIVWMSNNITFALLYWELDSGGPAVRAHHLRPHPDFAFPQQLSPEIAPPDWRPRFVDYLYLGFTNATAFSPTDAMPLAPWAKIAMVVQSLVSLLILGLVIARAVNVFT